MILQCHTGPGCTSNPRLYKSIWDPLSFTSRTPSLQVSFIESETQLNPRHKLITGRLTGKADRFTATDAGTTNPDGRQMRVNKSWQHDPRISPSIKQHKHLISLSYVNNLLLFPEVCRLGHLHLVWVAQKDLTTSRVAPRLGCTKGTDHFKGPALVL